MSTSNWEIVISPDERGLAARYPDFSLTTAYHKLTKFLRKRGFTQDSPGQYHSSLRLSLPEAAAVFQAVLEKHQWLGCHTATSVRLVQVGTSPLELALLAGFARS